MKVLFIFIASFLFTSSEAAWGMKDDKKVKLKDIDVLTLHYGKMTKGRRSSPMPQLECVKEGTAPCSAFKPKVVQCINRGSDGYDVQWECKTDMDNAFRFGEIDVSCEGYDYPDDPYVLHGSCGLKYSLDYTKEGMDQGNHHNYYGNDYSKSQNSYTHSKSKSSMSSIFADLLVYIGMGLVIYAFYKTCISSDRHEGQTAYSSTSDDYPSGGGGGGGYGWFGGNQQPPPHYPSNHGYDDDASCRNRSRGYGGTGTGGFWTGAATGGLLGYMFGNRQNGWGGRGGGGWGGGGWGGGGFSSSGGSFRSSSSGSSSSGTRSASGFGGTSRR